MSKLSRKNTKRFIKDFYFPNPNWDNLPPNFPNVPKTGLSKIEGHLLDGIKLAWMASEGRVYLVKTVVKRAAVTSAIIFVLLAGKNLITTNQTVTMAVSAKTVTQSIVEIIESTRSAILRIK